MKKVALMPYLRNRARMRGTATAPNSPRDTKLGVVRPRAMSPYIVSKSKVTQTRWRGIAQSFREPAGSAFDQQRDNRLLVPPACDRAPGPRVPFRGSATGLCGCKTAPSGERLRPLKYEGKFGAPGRI